MNDPRTAGSDEAALRAQAARWIVRRDRGLSAAESIEFELWQAADPRHAAAIRRSSATWSRLDRVPESVAEAEIGRAARRGRFRRWGRNLSFLAAAAAIAVIAVIGGRTDTSPGVAEGGPRASGSPALQAAGPRTVTLGDGTVVSLNAGSEVEERFVAAERRVLLTRGEAHFTVAKDPARPFVVRAGNLRVRAVGTAFNVNFSAGQVDVLVTEGKVGLERTDATPVSGRDARTSSAPRDFAANTVELEAGERAVLSGRVETLSAVEPELVVTTVEPAEIARTLAWQDSLLRLGGSTLAEIAVEFERRSGHRVILADPALARLRVGGRFRADDLNGFVNLLATAFEVDVERGADGVLVLRKKSSGSL
jgi:transmembrane sensor